MPKVSILVPAYNGEKFLADCLDSILAQDFTDAEIIVIDDQSRDGTPALIESYAAKNPRLRWWQNPVNLGLAGNFNACLQAARGRFIKFVLQDDLLLNPAAIRQMAAMLEAHPEVELVGCASHIIDSQARLVEHRDYFAPGLVDGRQVILACLNQSMNLIGEPTLTMFRRPPAIRKFDESYRQILDQEFWFHLLEQGKFGYLAEPLCAFRRHAAQQTEVNRLDIMTHTEDLRLLQEYLTRGWVRKMATPQILFSMIHRLRSRHDPFAASIAEQLERQMGLRGYGYHWLKRKVRRPFENLNRSFHKRLNKYFPQSHQP